MCQFFSTPFLLFFSFLFFFFSYSAWTQSPCSGESLRCPVRSLPTAAAPALALRCLTAKLVVCVPKLTPAPPHLQGRASRGCSAPAMVSEPIQARADTKEGIGRKKIGFWRVGSMAFYREVQNIEPVYCTSPPTITPLPRQPHRGPSLSEITLNSPNCWISDISDN